MRIVLARLGSCPEAAAGLAKAAGLGAPENIGSCGGSCSGICACMKVLAATGLGGMDAGSCDAAGCEGATTG